MDLEQRYGWRAMVQPDFAYDGIAIDIGHRTPSGLAVMDAHVMTMTEVPEGAMPIVGPALRLTNGAGRALLDALAEHYGGVSSLRALRNDYDRERARVDKLTDALISSLLLRRES